MKYKDFLNHLEKNIELELVFRFNGEDIKRDYHITEVLKSTIESIDCGGKVDKWGETVLQLIEPKKTNDKRYMQVLKAKKILEKSADLIDYDFSSNLVLEFKGAGATAAQRFIVSTISIESDKLIVISKGAATQCKALGRTSGQKTKSCCESASSDPTSKCCA